MTVSSPGSTFRPDIQGLRGIAVLAVVVFHSGWGLAGGFLGVDVFFVISGFVITATVLRGVGASGRFRVGQFITSRFWRLAPALGLVLASVTVLSAFILSPLGTQQEAFKTAIAAALGLSNIWLARSVGDYFGPLADVNPLLNAWSLSVEQQFYLVFAIAVIIAMALARLRLGTSRALTLLLGVIGLVSFASMYMAPLAPARIPAWVFGFYSPIPRAWEFCAGALLALLLTRDSGRSGAVPGSIARALSVVGAAAILGSFVLAPPGAYPTTFTLVPVLGAVLVILGGSLTTTPVSRLLSTRPLTATGDISYSWYLWHWPLIVFAAVLLPGSGLGQLLAIVASLGLAAATYRWVENPFRRRSRLPAARSVSWAVAFGLGPIALGLAALFTVNHGYFNEAVMAQQAAVMPLHLGAAAGCAGGNSTPSRPEDCTWNANASGRPIYLIGDSNAEQFSEAVVATGTRLGRPVTILTYGGCPPFPLSLDRAGHDSTWTEACADYVSSTLQWLSESPPGTVVIGFSDRTWTDPADRLGLPGDEPTSDRGQKLTVLRESLTREIATLNDSDHEVVVMLPVPHFDSPRYWSPESCSLLAVLRWDCGTSMPLSAHAQDQADVVMAIREGSAQAQAVIDLTPRLCQDGICSTGIDGVYVYRDSDHLSVAATPLILDDFMDALR